ncbi:MAG: hypothetical protein ABH834_01745, partial [Candidatus Altiarchaeota archaeon]
RPMVLVFVLGCVALMLFVVFGGIGYYLFSNPPDSFKGTPKTTSTSTLAQQSTTIAGTTTLGVASTTTKPSGLANYVQNLYSDLTGGRECGVDEECFQEAADDKCKKATFTLDTGRITQDRTVLGQDGEKCIVYYEITGVKDADVTSTDWYGLNMTCRIKPEDIQKDMLKLEDYDCEGSLWDRLSQYATK